MKNKTLAYSFKCTLPVMAGYIILGIGYGIILSEKGFGLIWALCTSLFIFAGSMQFVTVGLLVQNVSLLTAAIMTLLVNLRHLFYGISMLNNYKNAGKIKPYLIFALTDETFSLVCNPNIPQDTDKNNYYLYVSIFDQIWWVTGSVLGNIIGNVVPFSTAGIEFAMTALFVVMFVEQWERTNEHSPAITGVLSSIICLVIFGADRFLIPAMIAIVIALPVETNIDFLRSKHDKHS